MAKTAQAPAVGDDPNKPQRTPDELRKALEECTREKLRLQAAKKSTVDDYTGRIKEQDTEINGIMQQLRQG